MRKYIVFDDGSIEEHDMGQEFFDSIPQTSHDTEADALRTARSVIMHNVRENMAEAEAITKRLVELGEE